MADVPTAALESIRVRITKILPQQIRESVALLTDEQLWWRPNETSNSVANLLLHLSGSLNHYVNRDVGGIAYERDRPAEFSERRPIPREELLRIFDEMMSHAERTLSSLDVQRLGDPSPEPKLYNLLVEDLLAVLTHLSFHAGQIVWIAKMLHDGKIDDVWIRTHRELGGYKKRVKSG